MHSLVRTVILSSFWCSGGSVYLSTYFISTRVYIFTYSALRQSFHAPYWENTQLPFLLQRVYFNCVRGVGPQFFSNFEFPAGCMYYGVNFSNHGLFYFFFLCTSFICLIIIYKVYMHSLWFACS